MKKKKYFLKKNPYRLSSFASPSRFRKIKSSRFVLQRAFLFLQKKFSPHIVICQNNKAVCLAKLNIYKIERIKRIQELKRKALIAKLYPLRLAIMMIGIVVICGGLIVWATGQNPEPANPEPNPDRSFENLPNVAKEKALYRITFDKWSEVEIPETNMPEAKLKKWGDETWIKISYPNFSPTSPKQHQGKLKWRNGDKEVHLYPLEPRTITENWYTFKQLEQGGFEFEIILKSKPATNKTVLDIETQGLVFYYQPPLNQEQQEEGLTCTETECKDKDENVVIHRPENVVGSYAVYHESKAGNYEALGGKNYRAGKAGHIYRPKIIDSNSWEVWGELNIANGKLTVTIPQNFLDNAVYPIRHTSGATFGNEDAGGSNSKSENQIRAFRATGGAGTANSITTHMGGSLGGPCTAKSALYKSSDASFVEETAEKTDIAGYDWYTLNFATGPTIEAINYDIATWGSTPGNFYIQHDSGTGYYDDETYGTWPNPYLQAEDSHSYSIYATYTVPLGGSCTKDSDCTSGLKCQFNVCCEAGCTGDCHCWAGQVGASADDALQKQGDGYMGLTQYTVDILSTDWPDTREWGGFRWNGGDWPSQGATIDVAYMEIYQVGSDGFDDMLADLHVQDAQSPLEFTTDAYNITDRPLSTNYVLWDAMNMGTGWKQSPSLVDPIQEIVSDYSITALVLIAKPMAASPARYCSPRTWDYYEGPEWAAKLYIEYTPAAADVQIEAAAQDELHLRNVRLGPVWTDEDTAYVFYTDAAHNLEYRKTTNGGVDWAAAVAVKEATVVGVSVWFDKWTPGDSGTKIHIAYSDWDADDILYRSLDTSTDTLSAEKTILAGVSASSGDWAVHCLDITKSRGGNLYCGFWMDAGGEKGFYRSEDSGDNWAARADVTDGNAVDGILLLPGDEADSNDIWCIYWDRSADEISLKVYDNSGNSWDETSISLNMFESSVVFQMSAAQRASDNHVILAAWSMLANAAADLMVWDIGGAASITAKTNVLTDTNEAVQCAVFINQQNDDIYVAYLRGADWGNTIGAHYKKSADGGGSWGGEVKLSDDADDDLRAIWAGHSVGDEGGYFMPAWFNDDTDDLMTSTANAVAISAAAPPAEDHFAVTTEHSGTETAGTSFSVTLTAQDSDNETVTGYEGDKSITWTWTATNSPNSSTPTKPADGTVTFTAGVATVSGFTLVNSGETPPAPTITASNGSINGTSATITVNDGSLNYIKVEDAASGAGSEITTHSMTTDDDDTFQVWAAGYDTYGNYRSDESATWSTTGDLDSTPAGPATSTTFEPSTAPTSGTIEADHATATDDATGTITVGPGALNDFTLVTENAGTETAGTSFSVTATARDAEQNTKTDYTGSKAVAWTWTATNSPGSDSPSKPADGDETFTSGVMTKAGFTLVNTGETPTITITADTKSGTTSAITVNPASANNLNFSQQPSNTVAGATISPAITVQVRDQYNNICTNDDSTSVAMAINNNPGEGTLSGTTPQTASSGIATFSDLSIDKTGTDYTLDATSDGLATATSDGFNITVATLNNFLVAAPDTANSGTAFSTTITARDLYNNTTTTVSGNTTLSVDTGAISPSTVSDTEFTDDGVYTDNLTISNITEQPSVTLTATNGSATGTDTITVSGVPLAPTIGTPQALSSTSIRWNFTDNSSYETGFKLYDNTDTEITSSSNTDLSYLDETGLTPNTQYSGRYVKAFNSIGNSSASSTASAIYTLANVPASLSGTADSTTQITASWSANSNPSGTEYYSKNTTAGTNSGWTTNTSWSSSGLSCGTSYTFRVKARNGDGTETDFSDTTSVRTENCGGGGLPPGAYNPPTPPSPSPESPKGEFKVLINDDDILTNSRDISLKLIAGSDTKRMAISNTPDFSGAGTGQISYQSPYIWDLCYRQKECPDGVYTVYVKFYTQYGQASEVVSDTIILDTTAPEIKRIDIRDYYRPNEDVVLSGTTEAKAEIILHWNEKYGLVYADDSGFWIVNLGKMPVGKYPLELTAKDIAGNVSEPLIVNLLVKEVVPGEEEEEEEEEEEPEEIITVPEEAPLVMQGEWQLLPPEPIQEFVLAPLPKEIKILTEKFPELGKTFEEVGISKITDIGKLKTVELTLPGLTETLGLPTGVPVAELSPEIKEKLPTEIVFAKTGGELIDFNITLTITEEGKPQQKITTISGKPLQLVVKPDKPVKSVKGYVVFKSKLITYNLKPETCNLKLNDLLASAIFAAPVFAGPAEPSHYIALEGGDISEDKFQLSSSKFQETRLVLVEFEYIDPDGDGIYIAEIQAPIVEGEYEIITVMDYEDPDLGKKEIRLITVVDPEGYVYTQLPEGKLRVTGAIASLYWLNPETKQYELWPAKEYQQENPQITDDTGKYSFLVPEGFYYLKVETPNYPTYQSDTFSIREGSGIHMNIELKSKYWWLKIIDWKIIILIIFGTLLLYNFYRDKIREKLLKSKKL